MTAQEFEKLLVNSKIELTDGFKHGEASEMDIYTKAILDYQEIIAKTIFNEYKNIEDMLVNFKGDILKDNRTRFNEIMTELKRKK